MSTTFTSEWLSWKNENTPIQRTDKGDKRPSVSSVSSLTRDVCPKNSEVEGWEFRQIEIPNQDRHGYVDVWTVGTREDRPDTFCWWYVRTERPGATEVAEQ